MSLVNLDSSSCFQVPQFCWAYRLIYWGPYQVLVSFFLMLFEMKVHGMEENRKEDVKTIEGDGMRRKGVWGWGRSNVYNLQTHWPKKCLLHPHAPFGDLALRKRLQAFFSFYFSFVGVYVQLFPSAGIGALQQTWIQLPVMTLLGKLLNHHLHVWIYWCTEVRAPQGRSHFCVPVSVRSCLSSDL